MTTKPAPSTSARLARLIARGATSGALATVRVSAKDKGWPYVSKVGLTLDIDGAPLFLFSTLAAHTQDLLSDSRASLLIQTLGPDANPLQAPRTTLVGLVERLDIDTDQYERARYLSRHPEAAQYASFGDFSMWRMVVKKVHYVGGFGLAKWAKASDYLTPAPDLKAGETKIIKTINHEKSHQLDLALAQVSGCSVPGWQVRSIDTDGLLADHAKGLEARLDFKTPAKNVRSWRERFTRRL